MAVSISSRVCLHDLKPDENQAQLMSDSGKVQINKEIDVSCYCCPLWPPKNHRLPWELTMGRGPRILSAGDAKHQPFVKGITRYNACLCFVSSL